MPIEHGDSWFSPKSLEGEPRGSASGGVALCEWKGSHRDYCLFANDKVAGPPPGVRRWGISSKVKRATAQIVR